MAKAGDKKRLEENKAHLQRLKIVIGIANAVFIIARFVLNRRGTTGYHYMALALTTVLYAFCYSAVAAALAPHYSSSGELIYSGADLRTGGVMEYYHDIVYIAVFAQVAGAFFNKAWLVFLAIPAYCLYALWTNFLGPYMNAPSPPDVPESEADRKRREKWERQTTRAQKFATKR